MFLKKILKLEAELGDLLFNKKIIVMGGHKEEIISFGKTLDEAGNILLNK